MISTMEEQEQQRRRVNSIRTAIALGLIAVGIFAGYVAFAISQSGAGQ